MRALHRQLERLRAVTARATAAFDGRQVGGNGRPACRYHHRRQRPSQPP